MVQPFILKTLPFTPDLAVSKQQMQFYTTRIPFSGIQLTLASLYCLLSIRMDAVDFDLLFQHLSGNWIAGGNYNTKHLTWGSRLTSTRGRELVKVLTRNGFTTLSSGEPTYWPSHRNCIPDVIDFFISRELLVLNAAS